MRAAIDVLRRAAAIVRLVIGVPDYDRYLEHMRERHPQAVPLSREQFVMGYLRARYEKPGARCC